MLSVPCSVECKFTTLTAAKANTMTTTSQEEPPQENPSINISGAPFFSCLILRLYGEDRVDLTVVFFNDLPSDRRGILSTTPTMLQEHGNGDTWF